MTSSILSHLLTAIRWIVGLSVLYAAWLLKESEEGVITNKIESLRKSVEGIEQRTARFLQVIAAMISRLLDTLFGEKTFSLHLVYISAALSMLIYLILVPTQTYLQWLPFDAWGIFKEVAPNCAKLIGAMLLIAATTRLKVLNKILKVSFLLVMIYVNVLSSEHDLNIKFFAEAGAQQAAAFIITLACDIGFLLVTRWFLGRASKTANPFTVVLFAVCNLALIPVFLMLPMTVEIFQGQLTDYVDPIHSFGSKGWGLQATVYNLLDVFLCVAVAFLALAFALHMLLWPFIERNLYSINRHKIINNKKLLWAAGIAICAEPNIEKLIKAGLVKWVF